MKPTPKSPPEPAPLLVFGAHPDDIEFGCGGIIARETQLGRAVHCVVCSRGEAGSNGTPAIRTAEAKRAAKLLGATLEFLTLDGDALLEIKARHTVKIASLIRKHRPGIVFAPTLEQNQHPDHWRLGQLVREASRLARYGGLRPLKKQAPHAIDQMFFYAISPDAEPRNIPPILVDLSTPTVITTWTAAMEAHASQMRTRNYLDLQLTRARLHGLNASTEFAQPLWPNDPLVIGSLAQLGRSANRF